MTIIFAAIKKFIYLCGMVLLSLNMMAQIDLNDRNWDWNHAFQDEFVTSRSWDTIDWYSVPDSVWRGFPGQHVTHGNETQIYQYDHCIFDTENGWMRLYPDSTESFARNYPLVPKISNNLSDWHTFSCEWMPDHVLWYLDGNLVKPL